MNAARDQAATILGHRFELGQISFTLGGVIAATVALAFAFLAARLLQQAFNRHAEQREPGRRAAIYTVSRLARYVLMAIAIVMALSFLGIPVSELAVLAGAIGVGLGFGLQAIFNDFICGIVLLFDRTLRVGDFVELESRLQGEVRDINIRYTRITTNDNMDILVPNAEFVTKRVINWTHGGARREVTRRVHIPFSVAYGSDKEVVKTAALEAAAAVPFTVTLDGPRRPQVWLVEFAESSLSFELVVWLTADATKRPGAVKAAYLWALETALVQHGVELPFPQRDLHVRSLFGREGDAAVTLLGRRGAVATGDTHARAGSLPAVEPAAPATANDALEDVGRAAREEAERHASAGAVDEMPPDTPDGDGDGEAQR